LVGAGRVEVKPVSGIGRSPDPVSARQRSHKMVIERADFAVRNALVADGKVVLLDGDSVFVAGNPLVFVQNRHEAPPSLLSLSRAAQRRNRKKRLRCKRGLRSQRQGCNQVDYGPSSDAARGGAASHRGATALLAS